MKGLFIFFAIFAIFAMTTSEAMARGNRGGCKACPGGQCSTSQSKEVIESTVSVIVVPAIVPVVPPACTPAAPPDCSNLAETAAEGPRTPLRNGLKAVGKKSAKIIRLVGKPLKLFRIRQ